MDPKNILWTLELDVLPFILICRALVFTADLALISVCLLMNLHSSKSFSRSTQLKLVINYKKKSIYCISYVLSCRIYHIFLLVITTFAISEDNTNTKTAKTVALGRWKWLIFLSLSPLLPMDMHKFLNMEQFTSSWCQRLSPLGLAQAVVCFPDLLLCLPESPESLRFFICLHGCGIW